jgi:hypothetical protein
MGWLYSTSWPTKADIVEHCVDAQQTTSEDGIKRSWTTLKKALKGNNLWTIRQFVEVAPDGTTLRDEKYIALYALGYDKEDRMWGYKDMDETCGPYQTDCPVSWFDSVPDPGGYATAWREKCLRAAEKRKAAGKITDGSMIQFPEPITFTDRVAEATFLVRKIGRKLRLYRQCDGVGCRLPRATLGNAKILSPNP